MKEVQQVIADRRAFEKAREKRSPVCGSCAHIIDDHSFTECMKHTDEYGDELPIMRDSHVCEFYERSDMVYGDNPRKYARYISPTDLKKREQRWPPVSPGSYPVLPCASTATLENGFMIGGCVEMMPTEERHD